MKISGPPPLCMQVDEEKFKRGLERMALTTREATRTYWTVGYYATGHNHDELPRSYPTKTEATEALRSLDEYARRHVTVFRVEVHEDEI